ncbi:hypothetical protein RYR30_002494 [Flavobacterium psychrophilum]|nr:hypothetical protein [Flavobacterium psychrophilum]ELM3672517.1 hypothetical protein [Flavobacterium psychrophilum]ELM3727089.1 hypothetical protein [Flavobacterium psychrophilum]
MKKSKIVPVPKKQRLSYTLEVKASAKRYYLIGLTLNEISKLIDAPVRTIENWQTIEDWRSLKETNPIESKALDLFLSGTTYKQISQILKISLPTVARYLSNEKINRLNALKKN